MQPYVYRIAFPVSLPVVHRFAVIDRIFHRDALVDCKSKCDAQPDADAKHVRIRVTVPDSKRCIYRFGFRHSLSIVDCFRDVHAVLVAVDDCLWSFNAVAVDESHADDVCNVIGQPDRLFNPGVHSERQSYAIAVRDAVTLFYDKSGAHAVCLRDP